MVKLDKIFPDDIFFVSYPKSGTTWIRYVINNYITNEFGKSFARIELIPDMHSETEYCNSLPSPRMMKSHLPFQSEFNNIIYLCRDARDVAVSYYFHYKKYNQLKSNDSFESFLNIFNAGKVNFGLWNDHVNSWLDNKPARFLLIKYEDTIKNPVNEFNKILFFLGYDVDSKRLLSAIANADFSRMAALEKELNKNEPLLKNSNLDIPFIRKAQVGDYKNYFNKKNEEEFLKKHYSGLKRTGYI